MESGLQQFDQITKSRTPNNIHNKMLHVHTEGVTQSETMLILDTDFPAGPTYEKALINIWKNSSKQYMEKRIAGTSVSAAAEGNGCYYKQSLWSLTQIPINIEIGHKQQGPPIL